ncbi:dihydrofolate reductase family protein [Aliifodinibius sp. S!AR15-10]|uniref:dihydrofolate reductase family protein n=1 Tax=Aliifodinibius sp. S!AR15-10 TaxID=2950437 RepID=UPI0028542BFD|nr:dihydrofolate reductase family protein [Aliifodinibius sp. S!AR15-10]MDR8393740.1 dihydrofolate reductase family protein [Aliifodinibius sp. S!AR15-10]
MSNIVFEVGMSLDGFIAGPNGGPDNPIGDGGTDIHLWMYELKSWRKRLGMEGGIENQNDKIMRHSFERAGAYIMGRRMFDEGEQGWPEEPPFRAPVYVLTNHPRDPWVRKGGTTFTFVTEGIESALEQAKEAAGDKDIKIAGGADTIQQFLQVGLIDEFTIHLAPIFIGSGVRLFDAAVLRELEFEKEEVLDSPLVTHLRYKIK